MEWKKYKLGELIEVKRGPSLSGEHYSTDGQYIRLTCGNFDYQNNRFRANTSKDNLYYSGDFKPEFLLNEGDIITPLTEQAVGLLGSTALIPESRKYIQSQDVAKIDCKPNLDKDFAYYLLSSQSIKQQLSAGAQQTKIRHTSPDKIKDCTVWIPEIDQQRKIGTLLRSIDRKIEANIAINHNLEAMAKQLYDYWFVQFDFPDANGRPYKSSGGKMVWNEKLKREIPDGWEVAKVVELTSPFERGISYSSEDLQDSNALPMINLACFSKDGNYRTGELKYYSGSVQGRNVSPMDMLIACTDMTQNADIIGRPIFASAEHAQFTFSTDLALIKPKVTYKMFLYHTLRTDFYHKYIRPYASGTNVKHLNLRGVENYQVAIPPAILLEIFENLEAPLFEAINSNINQMRDEAKLRDELLPLLMNGQVSVEALNYDLSHD